MACIQSEVLRRCVDEKIAYLCARFAESSYRNELLAHKGRYQQQSLGSPLKAELTALVKES